MKTTEQLAVLLDNRPASRNGLLVLRVDDPAKALTKLEALMRIDGN